MSQLIQSIFNWPGNKLKEFVLHLNALTPFKKWEIMYKIGRTVLNTLGIRVLDDCVINWLTPLGIVIGAEQTTLTLYTMWFYWNENRITAIQPLTIIAFVVPVSNLPFSFAQSEYCK